MADEDTSLIETNSIVHMDLQKIIEKQMNKDGLRHIQTIGVYTAKMYSLRRQKSRVSLLRLLKLKP